MMDENAVPSHATPLAPSRKAAAAIETPITGPAGPRFRSALAERSAADANQGIFSSGSSSSGGGVRSSLRSSFRSSGSGGLALPLPAVFDVRVHSIQPDERWYNVRLVCRLRPDVGWHVCKRFREFDTLASSLRRHAGGGGAVVPGLPSKAVPAALMSTEQRQRRVLGLQRFCQLVLADADLFAAPAAADFFDLDFGLWHMMDDTDARPAPVLDAALERAVRLLQSRWRRALALRAPATPLVVRKPSDVHAFWTQMLANAQSTPQNRPRIRTHDEPMSR